jgi:aminomethyltransferase
MTKSTPLIDIHRQSQGKIVEFAGYLMPLQYTGVMDEHAAVRSSVGLFDVSHMGEIKLTGPGAIAAARRLVTNNVGALKDGQILYTPICYADGGIVDDCLVYRLGAEDVLVVVNASNIDKDHAWFVEQNGDRCVLTNASECYALIALQGPKASTVLAAVADKDVKAMPSFTALEITVGKVRCLASRTGYTGEDGYEIACAPADASPLWLALMEAGKPHDIKPCGLGARDTLRLEAKLPLYGNDIDATTTPLEAGLGWTVKLKESDGDFIGRGPLVQQKKEGLKRKLVCLEMRSRGIARHGHTIHRAAAAGTGERVGQVTSGTTSPTLGKAIALGYVPTDLSEPGTRLMIDVRGKPVEAEVVKGPFYKRSY